MHKYLLLLLLFIGACQSDDRVFVPKPRAFPKVNYPAKQYQPFAKADCPYRFDMPAYAKMVKNVEILGQPVPNDCWYDLIFDDFDARLHCTYYNIKDRAHYDKLVNDAFRMVNEHNAKANYIDEFPINKSEDLVGNVFDIHGPAATPFQFYLTDRENHFFRASLYLNTQARPDSLAPIYEFLKADAMQLIHTFEWK